MNTYDRKLDKLVKSFFEITIKRNPVAATYWGIHKYDHLMSDLSRKRFLEDITILKKFLKQFSAFDKKKLSFDKQIDRDIAIYVIRLSLFEYQDHRMWEEDPDVASSIGSALFPLFVKDFASFENRIKSITARLKYSRKIYEQTKQRIRDPVKLWTEMAIESCDRLPMFLEEIVAEAKRRNLNKNIFEQLEREVKNTEAATSEYQEYLESILPECKEKFILGNKNYVKMLKLRELGYSEKEILILGEKYLLQFKKQLKELAHRIKPHAPIEEVKEMVKSHHPKTFEEALEDYRKSMNKAREFIIKHNLVTMPKKERLIVIETPPYLRHTTPFAAYFEPAKFEKDLLGIYIVTPPENDPERIKEHSYASISNTSVHEAYPGHHLQLSCANSNPSLIRLFPDATEFVEGWAHFCEEYMKDLGYDDTLEARFDQTLDLIWRACRIIIDIKLHTGRMTFDEAIDFLVRETGMQKASAIAEVKRYTQAPTYQLSYLLGKHMIKQLKADMKKKLGKKFSEKSFNDTLLYSGRLPIKYHRIILEHKFRIES